MTKDQEVKLIGEIDSIFAQATTAENPITHLEAALNNLKISLSNAFEDIKQTTVPAITNNSITFTPEKRFLYNEKGTITAYTDGSSFNITTTRKYSGYGVLWNIGHPMNLSRPTPVDKLQHSNNAAEICGVMMAIVQAKAVDIHKLCIYTDSKYVMDTVNNNLQRWSQFDFMDDDGLQRPNLDLWKKLHKELANFDLDLRWVKAYNKNTYNTAVDKLAKEGAEKCRLALATTIRQRQ